MFFGAYISENRGYILGTYPSFQLIATNFNQEVYDIVHVMNDADHALLRLVAAAPTPTK